MIVFAPAKLNLDLRIVGRRADGMHEIDSTIAPLDFGDKVEIAVREDGQIRRRWNHPQVSAKDDLCIRAALLLQKKTGAKQGADIFVHKRIPIGGGLGGGSSDAAAVLRALNSLWKIKMPMRDLRNLGAQLGADVPFFLYGKAAHVRGIGEKLSPAKNADLQKRGRFLLLFPNAMSATAAAYSAFDNLAAAKKNRIMGGVLTDNINDLAPAVFALQPKVAAAARMLRRIAGEAKLSGSGACVYAAFESRDAAENARTKLPKSATAIVASAR